MYQNPWEFEQLLSVVGDLDPRAILEVGTMFGGTLRFWIKLADHVVAVDDQMRDPETLMLWANVFGTTLDQLQGDSHDPEIVEKAQELGPYDFVFIDADHTFASVEADWVNYGQMVVNGGAVAFHDILPRPGYGVSELWTMIKQGPRRWIEICHNETLPGNEGPCGIGVVWV
jgi:cephalosporin hydroxylase